jgi:hypothetical protein
MNVGYSRFVLVGLGFLPHFGRISGGNLTENFQGTSSCSSLSRRGAKPIDFKPVKPNFSWLGCKEGVSISDLSIVCYVDLDTGFITVVIICQQQEQKQKERIESLQHLANSVMTFAGKTAF